MKPPITTIRCPIHSDSFVFMLLRPKKMPTTTDKIAPPKNRYSRGVAAEEAILGNINDIRTGKRYANKIVII